MHSDDEEQRQQAWQRVREITRHVRDRYPFDAATATALAMVAAGMADMLGNSRAQFLEASASIFDVVHEAGLLHLSQISADESEVHKQPETKCPACAEPIDAITNMSGQRAPKPGQVMLCARCISPIAYVGPGQLRAVPPDEFAQLPPPQRRMIETMQQMMREQRSLS